MLPVSRVVGLARARRNIAAKTVVVRDHVGGSDLLVRVESTSLVGLAIRFPGAPAPCTHGQRRHDRSRESEETSAWQRHDTTESIVEPNEPNLRRAATKP